MKSAKARQFGGSPKKRCSASGISAMQRVMSRLASQIPAIWGKCLHEEERLRRQGTEAGPPPEPEAGDLPVG